MLVNIYLTHICPRADEGTGVQLQTEHELKISRHNLESHRRHQACQKQERLRKKIIWILIAWT